MLPTNFEADAFRIVDREKFGEISKFIKDAAMNHRRNPKEVQEYGDSECGLSDQIVDLFVIENTDFCDTDSDICCVYSTYENMRFIRESTNDVMTAFKKEFAEGFIRSQMMFPRDLIVFTDTIWTLFLDAKRANMDYGSGTIIKGIRQRVRDRVSSYPGRWKVNVVDLQQERASIIALTLEATEKFNIRY